MRIYWRALLDWWLGPRCDYGCGSRIPDGWMREMHVKTQHAGDRRRAAR